MCISDEKLARAKEVQKKYEDELLAKENVVGVSIGQEDEISLVVLVDKDTPHVSEQIPHELDGVPVIVRQVGKLEAHYQAKRESGWI